MSYENSKLDEALDKKLGYKEGSKEDRIADRAVKLAKSKALAGKKGVCSDCKKGKCNCK